MGCVPWELTWRELHVMAKSVIDLRWEQTALIAAILANASRDTKRKSEPFTIDDFHPMRQARKRAKPVADITILKALLR